MEVGPKVSSSADCLLHAGHWLILRADSAQVLALHGCSAEVDFDVGIQEEGQIWVSQ